jgi:hypothetical protein
MHTSYAGIKFLLLTTAETRMTVETRTIAVKRDSPDFDPSFVGGYLE